MQSMLSFAQVRFGAQVVLPGLMLAAVALALRSGAIADVSAAIVRGAPPSGGVLVWQVTTFREAQGVRETRRIDALAVRATYAGRTAEWRGSSNDDGIAEVTLPLGDVRPDQPLVLEVRDERRGAVLAEGIARWESVAWGGAKAPEPAFVRPTARDGALGIDVVVEGERLAPSFPGRVWVRATTMDGAGTARDANDVRSPPPLRDVAFELEPEPFVELDTRTVRPCASGWGVFRATAHAHVAGLRIVARTPSEREGHWYGALPVAPGSATIVSATTLRPHEETTLDLRAPPAARSLYAELSDASGRRWAEALPLAPGGSGFAEAAIHLPKLDPGLYELVLAGDARGAEAMGTHTRAVPILVNAGAEANASACALDDPGRRAAAGPFPRFTALDGLADAHLALAAQRRRAHAIALAFVAVGAVAEALLLLSGVIASRRALAESIATALASGARIDGAGLPSRRGELVALGSGLLLALLGFALLGAALWSTGR
jgi:hypothetical protein